MIAYHFRSRVGIPSQDPSGLLPQAQNLHAIVDHGVGLVVGVEDPVGALAVGPCVGAPVDRAGGKIDAQFTRCVGQGRATTYLVE